MQNKMDEAVCQSTSRRVRVIQVSHGTIWCHGHLHPCILGIKHYHFKFTHTLNWCKWLYKEKEGTVAIHSALEHYIQDLELKVIFSTGLEKVIVDKKFSDEYRSKNLTNPLKLHYSTTCSLQSTKQIIEQEKVQMARWAAACRWNGAFSCFVGWSQKQETQPGSQQPSPQERAARLDKKILEMLWCLTRFIKQLFVSHIGLLTSM